MITIKSVLFLFPGFPLVGIDKIKSFLFFDFAIHKTNFVEADTESPYSCEKFYSGCFHVSIIILKYPAFGILENVNRLILSPKNQRGRDFGIILRCLSDLGYSACWRILNAADYGYPQRRRRIFIFIYRNDTKYAKDISSHNPKDVLLKESIFAKAFPISGLLTELSMISLVDDFEDLVAVSDRFRAHFENAGWMYDGKVYTAKVQAKMSPMCPLSKIVLPCTGSSFYLTDKQKGHFAYLRGKKTVERTAENGLSYQYCEGSMSPYDSLDLPGRTMLTSEGSVNRSSHIIMDPLKHQLRFLTPVECERMNGFPDGWTDTGMSRTARYFMMGNALVCGIIERLGDQILKIMKAE